MFIITILNCNTNKVEIASVCDDEVTARNELINIIGETTRANNDVVYETIIGSNIATIYKKSGYLWQVKTVDKILALHVYETTN